MAGDQDFNAMQAQLGLVGQGGSFNPLGIPTPPAPAMPVVRHPGEISRDVVQQTQTQMATTLQTTSAMRLGGMGGLAFGGGGGGTGIGAVDAFAQQYRQNMANIQAQQLAPFSAQMMGVMGGMGGGFTPGMLPNPAMMTTPGMGIYRAPPPQQMPTVSPFPQMPLLQTPLTAMPPSPQFHTPIELADKLAVEAGQRRTAAMFATPGVLARGATDVGMGYMTAGVGAAMGARFGPMGAAIGGTLGMAAGMFGSERFGLGETAQHITDRLNPFRTTAIRSQQLQAMTPDFITGGADLNAITGRGLSRSGATHLARRLEDTAYSSDFQRQTGGAFSAADLTRITQLSGQQGLLNDAQSVDQIHDRVKGIAKSLVSFMKIANEPNVVEALKSMGRMRQMGLSIGETLDMAVDARMYSKMAGTSVKGIIESGGLPGAMLFQQQGLSAGLGMRMGIGAMGMAGAAVAGGAFTPQRLAMLGGVSGIAQHEMESSAAFLKMPMMAAAMSRMGRGGEFGMDPSAMRTLARGGMDINQMATRGVNNILEAVQKQGVGALGMFQIQQTELQDNIGRLLGPQGTQLAKMQQVMQTMRLMGLQQNPGGFATAALGMGMGNEQVKSMMSQANSPEYFDNLRRQLDAQKMELRALGREEFERNRPTMGQVISRRFGGFSGISDAYRGFRNFGEDVVDFFGADAERSQMRERGQIGIRTNRRLIATAAENRGIQQMSDADLEAATQNLMKYNRPRLSDQIRGGFRTLMGGDVEDRMQLHAAAGGWESALFGNNWFGRSIGAGLETNYRLGAATLFGSTGGLQDEVTNRAEIKERQQMSAILARGQAEGVGQRKERIADIVKKTGKTEAEVRGLLADVEISLGKMATEENRARQMTAPGMKSGMLRLDKVKDAIREAAKNSKINLSDAQVESMAVASIPMAETLAGQAVDAFNPLAIVDVQGDKQNKELLLSMQDSLLRDVFGSPGVDVEEGTRSRQTQLMSRLFGNQKDGRVGALVGLLLQGDEKKTKEALLAATDEEKQAAQTLIRGLSEPDRADAKRIGERLANTGMSAKDLLAGAEKTIRQPHLAVMAAQRRQQGIKVHFGDKQAPAGTKISDLLRSTSSEQMSDKMKELKQKFLEKELAGEDTTGTLKEAEKLVRSSGVQAELAAEGGTMAPGGEKKIEGARERVDETQAALSSAFPNAVDTFSEASYAMLRAAEMLDKVAANKRLLPDGNDAALYSTSMP